MSRLGCRRRLVTGGSVRLAGCRPVSLAPLSGRYLSFAEREEIAILRGRGLRGAGDRPADRPFAVDDLAGAAPECRDPGGVVWSTGPSTAQWHADRRARRPKIGEAGRERRSCGDYVQDRLSGADHRGPMGRLSPGPTVRWIGRRHGRRQDRRWARAWSPEQISNRLRVDFPDDESMRISHEAIYQALYVQGRGALRRELTACLRTGRALRVPRARTQRARQEVRHPRDHDQRAAGRGRGPGGARALGRRSHHRAEQLGDRHAGRAHHPVHDAAAPAADGRPRHRRPGQERPRAGRPRRRGGPRRDRRTIIDAARAAAPVADLGPGRRDGPARAAADRHRPARSTSATRTAPGSAAPTRTPTGCCASTSPRAPTSAGTAPTTSPRSPPHSTAAPARRSAGRPRQKRWRSCWTTPRPEQRAG